MVNIKIEGKPFQVAEGLTVLEAARECGWEIPSLCTFDNGECSRGSCRVCLVEVSNARGLVASCVYPVSEGMEITISSPKAVKARRTSVELLLADHDANCRECGKDGKCELQYVARLTGADESRFHVTKKAKAIDDFSPSIVRDTSKCILCGRCIERCSRAHGKGVLGFEHRGFGTVVAPAGNVPLPESACIFCGQCVSVCPTGALMPKSEIFRVDAAMAAGKHVVVQTAPAVRAALGEEFGLPVGTAVTGKMVAALRRLGFAKVFDTDFGADLTVMEEASELISRIRNGGVLPMITSCSPGWVNFAELSYGDLLPNLSSCKSPHQMQGAVIKSYYAREKGIAPEDIFMVSVMPCTAKKAEKERPEMECSGVRDVDAVLTVRELADMIRRSGIRFEKLPDEDFDRDIIGEASGAGVIFGASGGVMEAALRTAHFMLEGKEYGEIVFSAVRGADNLREASLTLGGMEINVAVVSGMASARPILDDIRAGKSKYQFIEIMGCPGGCINGGGMPIVRRVFLPNESSDIQKTYRAKRAQALYSEDERSTLRRAHENPQVRALYENFLGAPNSEKAHELLHTEYHARKPYKV